MMWKINGFKFSRGVLHPLFWIGVVLLVTTSIACWKDYRQDQHWNALYHHGQQATAVIIDERPARNDNGWVNNTVEYHYVYQAAEDGGEYRGVLTQFQPTDHLTKRFQLENLDKAELITGSEILVGYSTDDPGDHLPLKVGEVWASQSREVIANTPYYVVYATLGMVSLYYSYSSSANKIGRIIIEEHVPELYIAVQNKRCWSLLIFGMFWIAAMVSTALQQMASGGAFPMMEVFFVLVGTALVWMGMVGHKELRIHGDEIIYRQNWGFYRWTQTFVRSQMKHLRINREKTKAGPMMMLSATYRHHDMDFFRYQELTKQECRQLYKTITPYLENHCHPVLHPEEQTIEEELDSLITELKESALEEKRLDLSC